MEARRDRIRDQMGGLERIERQHARGRLTMRERIDALLDPGSFFELGTFARSERPEARDISPGDGKISGLGTIDGRPVSVSGDDVTVFHGSSSVVGQKRKHKAYELALENGHPYVYLGETGGARLPDTLGSEGFSRVMPGIESGRRFRQVPMITAIVGDSFGGSSFESAFSDVVIQVRGTCLAVSSPRVIEIATGEKVSLEELGGVQVHLRQTGQIDMAADDEQHAFSLIRETLSYLPPNAWSLPPEGAWDGKLERDERLYDLVPTQRNRAYDMHRVIGRLVDPVLAGPSVRGAAFEATPGERLSSARAEVSFDRGGAATRDLRTTPYLEFKPEFGRSLITCLARMGGQVVGILASNPMWNAGALDPDCCAKGTSFLCLCDSYNIPLVFLQDVPGFIVGKKAEHGKLLNSAIMFLEALSQAEVPKVTVVLRKAFGLAYFALCGNDMGGQFLFAWPTAEISFMDPAVGVNVVYKEKLDASDDPDAERARMIAEWSKETDPYGAAGIMNIDEIIDPADTRSVIIRALHECRQPAPPRGYRKALASWPTCY
jgi:acetyl-CoA carboxylase carboxyltransferase component